MSTETVTPEKKSILTDAMERAREIQDAKRSGEDIRTPKEIAARRILKRSAVFLAGTAVAVAAAIVISKKVGEAETSDEETPSED